MALDTPFSAIGTELRSVIHSFFSADTANPLQASVEVEELEPKDPALAATIKSMNDRGINTLYGRWLIEGAPRVLLFDTGSAYRFLNEWKSDLWSIAGIPGPDSDSESNEAIVFGYLIAWFLGEVWDYPRLQIFMLISYSMSAMTPNGPSLPTSTNGWPASQSPCARSDAST
jgi:hypothetical protein